MTRDLSWTLGKIGLDARKLLVFAVLGLLAAGLVVSSGPTPHVYAATLHLRHRDEADGIGRGAG